MKSLGVTTWWLLGVLGACGCMGKATLDIGEKLNGNAGQPGSLAGAPAMGNSGASYGGYAAGGAMGMGASAGTGATAAFGGGGGRGTLEATIFQCQDGTRIPIAWTCNGIPECMGGDDESPMLCPPGGPTFMCSDGTLIQLVYKCNGAPDCSGGDDENPMLCDFAPTYTCADGMQIPASDRCDGKIDCMSGDDEAGMCGTPRFVCSDGTMLSTMQGPCNGVVECMDGSDEAAERCGTMTFTCGDGTQIPAQDFCDGEVECAMGEDERCMEEAPFWCANMQEVVGSSKLCDGVEDCSDASDEANCMMP